MSTKSIRKRGTTLVEVTLTMTLSALIIGAATTLYSFIAIRTADAITQFTVLEGANYLMKGIEDASKNAIKVETKILSGKTCLVCTVPNSGVDANSDGFFEYYSPKDTNKLLRETYVAGRRIWFYPADITGGVATTGNYWFRASRTDDANITNANKDESWSVWSNTVPKSQIPGTVTFTINSGAKLVSVSIQIQESGALRRETGGLTSSLRKPIFRLRQRCLWRGAL